ncbi:hypothetical protein PTMSG1_05931 [Pyrenophora teres f. maculata]|nr:hypothetical protein PTMSG1_05931 [Pyrenophora teres f. maculata]
MTSPPTLYRRSVLQANPTLSQAIIDLVNDCFAWSKDKEDGKWDNSIPRFDNVEEFYSMLGEDEAMGAIAVLFEEAVEDGMGSDNDSTSSGQTTPSSPTSTQTCKKPIACAATIPWRGGHLKEGAGSETGWEIKIVCVDASPMYQRCGLAVRLLAFLEEYLVGLERDALVREGVRGSGSVDLWILAAECQAGPYWRKRGYVDVRKMTEGPGVWSCREEFEIVVLKRRVEF